MDSPFPIIKFKRATSSTNEVQSEKSVKLEIPADELKKEETAESSEHSSFVATHYNELKESGLAARIQSRIFYMRNLNNWIKVMFLNEYLEKIKDSQKFGEPLRVLDLCCGKGGDLLKYQKAGISHLICTDIADVSIEQCKSRYEAIRHVCFTSEFFACDSTLVRLREHYKDPSMKLNLVSCQFAYHYCFESLSQAECMTRNASECLQPGGYFIATIPDANEIMRRCRQEGKKSFGNDIYNIEFLCDTDPPPLFGGKYQFHLEGVVDCPEFLVYFPQFVKLCRKYGLQLVRNTRFDDYFNEKSSKGKQLLYRMNALESYPNRSHKPLSSKEKEYEHAKQRNAGNQGNSWEKSVKTLSKSEWEATTLYMVCAFKKCKNTWDSEGKAVYEFDD